MSRMDFLRVASCELSAASGSKADRAETPVRSTSMGVVFFGSWRSMASSLGGSRRFAVADSVFWFASSSLRFGSRPWKSRNTVSSKLECATRSSTS